MPLNLFRLLVSFAKLINIGFYHFRSILEKLGMETFWAKELAKYFHTTPAKIESVYRHKREQTASLWKKKSRTTTKAVHSFYQETDYFVYRQNHFHRLKIYLDLVIPMLFKRSGSFCEYGGGVGPFTRWLIKFFPNWHYHIVDLDCPVFTFAKWRFKSYRQVSFATVTTTKLPLTENYDLITCKQVLEHVPDPLRVVKHLIAHLKPGGWLFLDYIYDPGEENLVTGAKQRRAVLTQLKTALTPLFAINPNRPEEGYGVYLKRK